MANARKDVDYVAYSQRGGEKVSYASFAAACEAAVSGSLESKTAYVIDVYVRTRQGALRFAGGTGIKRFAELGDPERVFERIEVRADSLGVPT